MEHADETGEKKEKSRLGNVLIRKSLVRIFTREVQQDKDQQVILPPIGIGRKRKGPVPRGKRFFLRWGTNGVFSIMGHAAFLL